MELTIILLIIGLYFIPAFIALGKSKKDKVAITALNIVLGWTLLGWVVALVWALLEENNK